MRARSIPGIEVLVAGEAVKMMHNRHFVWADLAKALSAIGETVGFVSRTEQRGLWHAQPAANEAHNPLPPNWQH
jgi:hypothetical protein